MWVWIQTQVWHRMCTPYTCSTIPSAPGTTCSTQTISLSSLSCEHFWSLEAADRKCLTKRWRMAAGRLNTTLGIFRTLWCWTQSTLQRFRAREWRDTGQELMHLIERVQLRCQSYHRPFLAQVCQLDCLGPFADALLTQCFQQLWNSPTSLMGQELHLLALEERTAPVVFYGHLKWRWLKIEIYFPG